MNVDNLSSSGIAGFKFGETMLSDMVVQVGN